MRAQPRGLVNLRQALAAAELDGCPLGRHAVVLVRRHQHEREQHLERADEQRRAPVLVAQDVDRVRRASQHDVVEVQVHQWRDDHERGSRPDDPRDERVTDVDGSGNEDARMHQIEANGQAGGGVPVRRLLEEGGGLTRLGRLRAVRLGAAFRTPRSRGGRVAHELRFDEGEHRERRDEVDGVAVSDEEDLADDPVDQRARDAIGHVLRETRRRRREDQRRREGRACLHAAHRDRAILDHGLDVLDLAQHQLVVEEAREQDDDKAEGLIHEERAKVSRVVDDRREVHQRAARDDAD